MTAESIARALSGRKVGATWMGLCPAHNDRNPSLAISEKDGVLLAHCHAGCPQGLVVKALQDRGLWQFDERVEKQRIVAEYEYADKTGKLLYQVVRYEPKSFRQRYPDNFGGWVWKKHPRQILYRLPEVLEAPIVFVVEGEKDAESLRAHGFVATTAAGGAEAPWLPSFTDTLRGREVILIPDNDEAGHRRVLKISRALLGNASRIIIVDLDGAKDIAAWFAAGHSEMELIEKVNVDGEHGG